MNRDYLNSDHNAFLQYAQLNSEEFKIADQIKNKYLLIPLMKLVGALDGEIGE